MSDQSMKHPPALWTLFLSEMWERFCYYGMRALLTLFLIESMMKGNTEAFLIYGAYTALVYAAPILGGRLADKYLGYQYAIMLGAVLMSIGEFLIVASTDLLDLDRALRDTLMLIGMGGLIGGFVGRLFFWWGVGGAATWNHAGAGTPPLEHGWILEGYPLAIT